MVEFNDRRLKRTHSHPYNPNDPHAMRPEGECETCDKMRESIRDRLPEDPFEGLG